MAHRTVLIGIAVVVVASVGGIFVARGNPRNGTTPIARPAGIVKASSGTPPPRATAAPAAVLPVHLYAAHVPEAARSVAIQYALDVFRSTAHQLTDSWVHAVADLCTRSWLAHIEGATSAQQLVRTSSHPRLAQIFASWAPRDAVAVTVVVQMNKEVASLYIELRLVRHHYLVAAAQ